MGRRLLALCEVALVAEEDSIPRCTHTWLKSLADTVSGTLDLLLTLLEDTLLAIGLQAGLGLVGGGLAAIILVLVTCKLELNC